MPRIQASAPAFTGFRQLPGGGFPFTMVPNQFLDEIVPIEKPCVVKVVCLVLRRTLGWIDQTGQRRQQDQVAYSEFAREMNMSTQAVADGLKIAIEKGYIVRVKAGTMRDATSGNPEAASYSLRWMNPLQPIATHTPPSSKEESKESIKKGANDSEILEELAPLADSENQMVLSSLINRDMINKADSEKKIKMELKTSSRISETQKAGKFSGPIGNLISDFGQQFGDEKHRLSNIKQALNCWEKSGLPEKEFAQVLYQARNLTRQNTNALKNTAAPENPVFPRRFSSWVTLAGDASFGETPQLTEPTSTSPRNRMPYFFKVLHDLIRRPATETATSEKTQDKAASPTLSQSEVSLHNKKKRFTPRLQRIEETVPEKTLPQSIQIAEVVSPVVEGVLAEVTLAEVPAELNRLACKFGTAQKEVVTAWQGWEISLQDSRLKALARRFIFLEKSQVQPDLQPYLFHSGPFNQSTSSKEIALVFRNSFDSRYAASYINEIAESLEATLQTDIQIVITHG